MEQNILLATDKKAHDTKLQPLSTVGNHAVCFCGSRTLASSTSHGSLGGMDSTYFHGCGHNDVQ